MRYFNDTSPDYVERILAFRPEVFAGSLDQLRRVAREFQRDVLRAFEIRSIIIFAAAGDRPLAEAERDELWAVFQAPVFEQHLSAKGELVAAECEAHDGLHVTDSFDPAMLPAVVLDVTPCGCGKTSPRIPFGAPDSSDAAAA